MRHLPRLDPVLIQALIAASLSFAHLHDIASAAGQNGWKAWAYPVSVDLLLVASWRRLRSGTAVRLAWAWFLVSLTASLGANVATAGFLDLGHAPDWLRMLVAGWPAAAFLGGTLLAHTHTPNAPEPQTVPDLEPEPTPDPVYLDRTEPASDPVPALEPAAEPVPVPGPAAPPALVAYARKLADDHHTRTGQPIPADLLRTRLGVPTDLADAIAAELQGVPA
ncbi:hypothetical protein ABIA33_003986 [Streptacidiphilus sp. MAP12-16]|uniref:DUF2637 domain-containing protein n=1 Tax=Streptacidiphilus sp. MAP12-16 TaxID=3156300 RepID=UPI003518BE7C